MGRGQRSSAGRSTVEGSGRSVAASAVMTVIAGGLISIPHHPINPLKVRVFQVVFPVGFRACANKQTTPAVRISAFGSGVCRGDRRKRGEQSREVFEFGD